MLGIYTVMGLIEKWEIMGALSVEKLFQGQGLNKTLTNLHMYIRFVKDNRFIDINKFNHQL